MIEKLLDMAKYISIKKLLEKDDAGFYEVETNDDGGAHFYIGIDRNKKLINIYSSDNISNPSLVIDPTNHREIDENSFVKQSILIHVIAKAVKTFDLTSYPKFLSYQV